MPSTHKPFKHFNKKFFRTLCSNPENRLGLELLSMDEAEEIEPLLFNKLGLKFSLDQIYYDLNPYPLEGNSIVKRYPQGHFDNILNLYGFVSPVVVEIEAYADCFNVRYPEGHDEYNVREGLKAEKAFHLILQNMAVPVNYPEPMRDWRTDKVAPFAQTRDFYVPSLGKLEVKSVTPWNGSNRVNIPYSPSSWEQEKPNLIIALSHIGARWIMLCGAMPGNQVSRYVNTCYHVKQSNSSKFTGPFVSVPLADFPINGKTLYDLLLRAKSRSLTLT